jgi:hypothetical protein
MTSVLLTVQPIGSVALAALILGESPSPLQLCGVALILAALLTAGRARSPVTLPEGARIPPEPASVEASGDLRRDGDASARDATSRGRAGDRVRAL